MRRNQNVTKIGRNQRKAKGQNIKENRIQIRGGEDGYCFHDVLFDKVFSTSVSFKINLYCMSHNFYHMICRSRLLFMILTFGACNIVYAYLCYLLQNMDFMILGIKIAVVLLQKEKSRK